MSNSVTKIPLKETCFIKTGKLDSNHAETDGAYPFFTCAPTPSRINTYAFDQAAILLAGNNAQGNFHVNKYSGKFNAYQRTYILSQKEEYSLDYLFYSLKLGLSSLKEQSQGSQTKFLTMPILNNIPISDIDFKDQQKIASILSTLDAKIELNNHINTQLEQMAKMLYDYWFVQFDFPDANGKPYKSSGGKMVWSEELKREIPEGWEDGRLGDWVDFKRGISYTKKDISEGNGIPLINLNSFNLSGKFKKDGTKSYSGKYKQEALLEVGDLVIAITDVTRNADIIGRGFAVPDLFDHKPLMSCDVACVHSEINNFSNYLEMLFNSQSYHDYIKYFASGTLVLHLDLNGVKWFKTFLPPDHLLSKFSSLVNTASKQITINQRENQKLIELRDWLLPMLMNGQVKVG